MNLEVNVKNVSLKYNDFTALEDISFTLTPKKIYGLIGRNGAGKTSLLSLLASLNYPTSGSIEMGGKEPFENPQIMPRVCFINTAVYDEDETAQDYFEFADRYRPDFDPKYAEELTAQFKFPLDKPVNKLSSGKQSALKVTLGLASRCPVTIFDEVYLNMDAPTRELFYQEVLREQNRRPRIMILSTHLVSEMEYLFDHVLILDRGHLIVDEAYDKVIERGAAITGETSEVDDFVRDLNVLNSQQLGKTKSVMIYGQITDDKRQEAIERELEIGPVSLQNLFIHLTREDESNGL